MPAKKKTAKKKRKATPAQLSALAKGRAAMKRKRAAAKKKPAKKRTARKAAPKKGGKRKAAPKRKRAATKKKPAKRKPAKKATKRSLTPAERRGFRIVDEALSRSHLAASGEVRDCSAFVRDLSAKQQKDFFAAVRLIRKAAGSTA